MKILVTGGAGFIGSYVCEALMLRGHEITIIDNMDSFYSLVQKVKNLNILHGLGKYKYFCESIFDRNALETAMKGKHAVIHLAAQPGIQNSFENPEKSFRVNSIGTWHVLNVALKLKIKKFINASSSSVYGNAKPLPFDEKYICKPISPYGESKLVAEQLTTLFYENYGLPALSLRYFTVYGSRMRPDLAIRKFITNLSQRKPIEVYGNGKQTRDFTYIDDIVNGTLLALQNGKFEGEIYNLGGGSRVSINNIINKISELMEIEPKIIYKEKHKGDAQNTLAKITKAKKELGWSPKTKLNEGLEITLNEVRK